MNQGIHAIALQYTSEISLCRTAASLEDALSDVAFAAFKCFRWPAKPPETSGKKNARHCFGQPAGLKAAAAKHFQGAIWQRCQVHLMRNVWAKANKKHREALIAGCPWGRPASAGLLRWMQRDKRSILAIRTGLSM